MVSYQAYQQAATEKTAPMARKSVFCFQRKYTRPFNILKMASMSLEEKRELLESWHKDRMAYLYMQARDGDWQMDDVLHELEESFRILTQTKPAPAEEQIA